ncbi:MAG: trypsin-like peptidase domain-containing protein, partial [Mariniblastus sp.]|nr:trypsin-like peptidase domain-containing protein [Mariniblastus sp.]
MEIQRTLRRSVCLWISILPFLASLLILPIVVGDDDLTESELALIKSVESNRIKAINRVIGSVIAIYDDDRQGGGSGVIIDPSGIALTNHHVIMGAGIEGWGGLADGKMYKWKLIGTDPGGDLAIIQMEGKNDFPFTPLADSDKV